MKKIGVILLIALVNLSIGKAQEATTPAAAPAGAEQPATGTTRLTEPLGQGEHIVEGYNKYSIRPIHSSDIMYKKSVVRMMDLREPQNLPLFSTNKWISKLLIDAVRKGDITPYRNDSLDLGAKLSIDEFNERIKMPSTAAELTQEEKEIALANGDSSAMMSNAIGDYYPKSLYQLEIKEDIIFDKQRSRMYYDIQSLTMFVPSDEPSNVKGIQLTIASFEYKELVNKLFKDNPNAIWFNPENDQQHKNLADAFELRLFSSYIEKVSNPTDSYLVEIYGQDQHKGILASQWTAHTIMEYEHNLWEF
jgi:gliding motility associated protien GldN